MNTVNPGRAAVGSNPQTSACLWAAVGSSAVVMETTCSSEKVASSARRGLNLHSLMIIHKSKQAEHTLAHHQQVKRCDRLFSGRQLRRCMQHVGPLGSLISAVCRGNGSVYLNDPVLVCPVLSAHCCMYTSTNRKSADTLKTHEKLSWMFYLLMHVCKKTA